MVVDQAFELRRIMSKRNSGVSLISDTQSVKNIYMKIHNYGVDVGIVLPNQDPRESTVVVFIENNDHIVDLYSEMKRCLFDLKRRVIVVAENEDVKNRIINALGSIPDELSLLVDNEEGWADFSNKIHDI